MMNILMVMYGKGIGGAELQFIELARELAKRHHIRFISLGGDGALKATALPSNVDLRVYSYDGKFSAAWGLMDAWLSNFSYAANSIVTTSFVGNVLGYALSQFKNVRLVSLQTVSKAMRYPILDRIVLRRFDQLIAGSSDIREYLIGHGQKSAQIQVVNNWVDFSSRNVTSDITATRQKFGIGVNDTVLGCIGRLHYQKGQEYLIQAFRELRKQRSELRLVLVGDGPNAEMLKAEARDLGGEVIFTGSVVGDNYNNLLNAFDIYVQPSRFEGLPRTLLDAMYLGKPIVATAVNGNLDALRDRVNALLIPAEEQHAIVRAVLELCNDAEFAKRLAENARQDAVRYFSMENQLKVIERIVIEG